MAALKLAKDEFIATHRPRITVRFVENKGSLENNHWGATLTIVNVGDSTAIIENVETDIARRDPRTLKWKLPFVDFTDQPNMDAADLRLKSGQPHTFEIESLQEIAAGDIPELMHKPKRVELLAVGRIRYRDDNGTIRLTGFNWIWNAETERFDRIKEGVYSYED
jgi:hypothetical protein